MVVLMVGGSVEENGSKWHGGCCDWGAKYDGNCALSEPRIISLSSTFHVYMSHTWNIESMDIKIWFLNLFLMNLMPSLKRILLPNSSKQSHGISLYFSVLPKLMNCTIILPSSLFRMQWHMHRINAEAGTRITIYHSFHAEVAVYKQHHWRWVR